jgi:glycosyl transferase, family 25
MKAYCINLDSRPDRMESFIKQNIPLNIERYPALTGANGHEGCTKTHLKLLSEQTAFPFAVFEDDCLMLGDWSIVEKAISQLPENWDLLYLGATLNEPLTRYSENLFVLKKAWTTHAIIYNTKDVVDFIVKNHNTHKIDAFYNYEVQEKFKCFITYPLVANQSNSPSNIRIKRKWGENINDIMIPERYKKFTDENTIR